MGARPSQSKPSSATLSSRFPFTINAHLLRVADVIKRTFAEQDKVAILAVLAIQTLHLVNSVYAVSVDAQKKQSLGKPARRVGSELRTRAARAGSG